MNDYKEVNGFIYEISDDGTEVTIACKAVYSNTAGRLLVNQQVKGILTPTGSYEDVRYEGTIYVGIVYQLHLNEEQLIRVLSKDR